MIIRDYNGTGKWSCESIQQRYAAYAANLNIASRRDLTPYTSEAGKSRWIYPVMDKVIDGIEADDAACVMIGTEFIEENGSFPYGRILKSNTARALRRATLSDDQKNRIRKRVTHMLLAEYTPHEYREYAKLLRRIGVGPVWPRIQQAANLTHPSVIRYYRYFEAVVATEST